MTTPDVPQDQQAQGSDQQGQGPDQQMQQPGTPEQNNIPKVLTREVYEWYLKEKCGVADIADVQGGGNLLDKFLLEYETKGIPVDQERFEDFYKLVHEAQYLAKHPGAQPFPEVTLQQVLEEYGNAHAPVPVQDPPPLPDQIATQPGEPINPDDVTSLPSQAPDEPKAPDQAPEIPTPPDQPGSRRKLPTGVIKWVVAGVVAAGVMGVAVNQCGRNKGEKPAPTHTAKPPAPAPSVKPTTAQPTAKPQPVETAPLKAFTVLCTNRSIPENCKPADSSLYTRLNRCKFNGLQYLNRPLTISCTDAKGYPGPVYTTPYKIEDRAAYTGTPYGDNVEFTVYLNE